MVTLCQGSPLRGKIWIRLWIDNSTDMKTMRKFLLWGVFPFLLISCEMYDKQSLCAFVSWMNYMCPTPMEDSELVLDSVLYKGRDRRIRLCYSYKESESREEYEACLRDPDIDFQRYRELMDWTNAPDAWKELFRDMSNLDFDLQVSYFDSNGNVLLDLVFTKDEYNMTAQEVKDLYAGVLVESDLKKLQSRLPEIQWYDERFVLDSLAYDLSERKAFLYLTACNLNLEGVNVDTFFLQGVKGPLILNAVFENHGVYHAPPVFDETEGNYFLWVDHGISPHSPAEAISEFGWEFVYRYKMDGKSLYEFSVSKEDVEYYEELLSPTQLVD